MIPNSPDRLWQCPRSMIEVRTTEPTFAPSDVKRYIGRTSVERRVSWPEVAQLASGKHRKLPFDGSPYLLAVLSPDFALTPHGLFLHGMPPHGIVEANYAREHGRFTSEGLNNHVHLAHFTKSRVAQFEIGVRAIRQWIHTISAMPDPPARVTLYLNGSTHFTICVYSEATDEELAELDQRIGGDLVMRSAAAFLDWGAPRVKLG